MSDRLLDQFEDQARVEALAQEEWDASCQENPFPLPPEAIPFAFGDDDHLYGTWNPFGGGEIAAHIALNSEWLQDQSRTTAVVRKELFPQFRATGMSMDKLLVRISRSLFDAGYTPSNHGPNPTWSFQANN